MSANCLSGNLPIFHAAYPTTSDEEALANKKVKNIILRVISAVKNFFYQIIHKLIGLAVLPAQPLSQSANIAAEKKNIKREFDGEEIKFQTADDVTLDGMFFQGNNCKKSDRTVILFNGNGIYYEAYRKNYGLFDIDNWKKEGWNVILFNYRGVRDSKGIATRDGLILDGDAALQYARDQLGVPENKILLHGHSLGGGIAGEVAAKRPEVNYCNDRSFSSLSQQVKVMFGNGIIGSVASKALRFLGWEFNSGDNWNKIQGKKFAIFHNEDAVIPKGARHHELLGDEDTLIELTGNWGWQQAHMRAYSPRENTDYFNTINVI